MKVSRALEVLGVSPSASASDLKKAYRSLALSTHPDKNPNDPNAKSKFQEVSAAYKKLTAKAAEAADGKDKSKRNFFGGRAGSDEDEDDEDDEDDDGNPGFDMSESEMFDMFDSMFGDLMDQFGPAIARGEMDEEDVMEQVMMGGINKMMFESMGLNPDDMDERDVSWNRTSPHTRTRDRLGRLNTHVDTPFFSLCTRGANTVETRQTTPLLPNSLPTTHTNTPTCPVLLRFRLRLRLRFRFLHLLLPPLSLSFR